MIVTITASLTDGFVSGFFDSIHTYVATHFYISPFWWWCLVGAAIWAFLIALAFFFPVLRPVAGALGFAVIAALVGYRRGENDANAHNAAIRARERKVQQKPPGQWRW